MERVGIKAAICLIAASSTAYWAQPPHFWGGPTLAILCALWSLLAIASFSLPRAEDWTYRLTSFLAMTLVSIEGGAGMLGLDTRAGLLGMAALHSAAFVLALVGRYQKAGGGRKRLL